MFGILRPQNVVFTFWLYLSPKIILMLCLAAFASTPVLKTASDFFKMKDNISMKKIASVLLLVLFFVCIVFVTSTSYNPFIYFRF